MKKLSLYAMLVSIFITLVYTIKLHWFVETDAAFYRVSAIALVSEIGLWCAYFYARDYEACKAQEEHYEMIKSRFMVVKPDDLKK